MGLDLSSFEAFKKQATSGGGSTGSVGSTGGGYSSNPVSGDGGSANRYSDVSLFAKEEEEEKKVANAYDEFFEEAMFGSEEESSEDATKTKAEKNAETTATGKKTSDTKETKESNNNYQKELDSKYKDTAEKSAEDAFADLTAAGVLNDPEYYKTMLCATKELVQNDQWKISIADENGNISDQNLADAVAASFDSEIDLYIQAEVEKVIKEYGQSSKVGYLSEKGIAALAAKGIRVDAVGQGDEENGSNTNRVYSFSLVEVPDNFETLSPEEQRAIVYADDAKIIEDKAGNKGSYLFADALIPDGCAQNSEVNMSSILDQMGYDCVSKADFIGSDGKFDEAEYQAMLSEVGDMVNSGEYSARETITALYGNTREICDAIKKLWNGDGAHPGQTVYGGSGNGKSDKAKDLDKKEKEKEINDKYETILSSKKAAYKEEHGEDATGKDLAKLETQAKLEAKSQS